MKLTGLMLILGATMLFTSLPSYSQGLPSYHPNWQGPVWQQSTNGQYYDATGTIPGTVPGHMLHVYGGRLDGGPAVGPVPGSIQAQQWYWMNQQRRRNNRTNVFINPWF